MKESFNYTAADIERYHSGQLSASEMHALEKAALDDPFLADALEGYVFTKTPAADLSVLQEKLQLRIEKEQNRKVFFLNSAWMKIAASIILVAGLGWIIIKSTTSTTQQNEVAVNKSNNEYKLQPLPSVTEDSTAVVFNTPNVNDKVILKNEVVSAETPSQPVRSQTNTAPIVSQPSAIAPQTDQLQEVVVQNQLKTFSPKYDSTKNVVIAREEKAASNVQPSTDTLRHVDVVLQSTKVAPDEEFVVTKKSKDLASTSRRMQIKVDTLEPAEGWTRYDDYIADNLKTPDEFKLKPTTGFVELSFDVNKNGEPVNITVTKSLCDKCDEEAIRLLKEGPKWKAGSKKGKIKIKF